MTTPPAPHGKGHAHICLKKQIREKKKTPALPMGNPLKSRQTGQGLLSWLWCCSQKKKKKFVTNSNPKQPHQRPSGEGRSLPNAGMMGGFKETHRRPGTGENRLREGKTWGPRI